MVASVRLDKMEPQPGDLLIATEVFAFTPVDAITDPGTAFLAVTNRDNTRHTLYTFFCSPHTGMQGQLVAG